MSLVLLLGNRSANESLRRQLTSPRSTPLFGLPLNSSHLEDSIHMFYMCTYTSTLIPT